MKGYKVFNPNWTCRGFQYEVGKTYKHEGNIELCGNGFHFCRKLKDCFSYYEFNTNNKVAEVEAIGLIQTGDDKSVTDKITIIRELTWHEVLDMVNTGKDCTGFCNTGNRNTGDSNTGNRNTGDRNTGNWNTGNRNTGDWNTGDWNTGNWNCGCLNTGDWNTGNLNCGCFNTTTPNITLFNKPSNWSYNDWIESRARKILAWNSELTTWIYSENMSEEEKEKHLEHETLGGYLKVFTHEEMCRNMWNNLTEKEKQIIKDIPNFDAKIFKEITGIDVEEDI